MTNETEDTTVKESSQALMDLARNALKKAGGGAVKVCTVCGKPESRDHKALDASGTIHAEAKAGKYSSKLRMLEKALGMSATDLVLRGKFNAQAQLYKEKLIKAREEHDAYEPEEKDETNKAAMTKLLSGCLDLLRAPVEPRAEGWTPVQLAEVLHSKLTELLAPKTE